MDSSIKLETNKASRYQNKNNKAACCKYCSKNSYLESSTFFIKYPELKISTMNSKNKDSDTK